MKNKTLVFENAVKYFNGNELAAKVWMDKYALKTNELYLEETPNDTIIRLSSELARIEKRYPNTVDYDTIYNLLVNYNKFVFGGSILFGVGNNLTLSTLGNCFVLDYPYDSYSGIFKTDQELAQICKRRGGVGLDISSLRPKKSPVNNAANTSTGASSFMHRFSNTTREVAQEGRRGALMLTMNIDHPDIEEFITAKDDLTKITGANISVKITDEFMLAVKENKNFMLHYDHINILVKAKKLWNKIVHQAWKNAEPGVLFWDKIIKKSPADCYEQFETISTNPCSELPLCAYDSCRLGAINLYAYILNPFTIDTTIDWKSLERDTILYQKLMDDIIDLENEKIIAIRDKIANDPEPSEVKKIEYDLWYKIQYKLIAGRRTGLGIMGLADALAALGLKYGSVEANEMAEKLIKTIAIASYKSSVIMAEERGAFPLWNLKKEVYHSYIARTLSSVKGIGDRYVKYGRRNIANLTIAPTGSISMLAQVSSGIEPVFDLIYTRKRKVTEDNPNKKYKDESGDWWEEYEVFHPKYKDFLEIQKFVQSYDNNVIYLDPYCDATAHEVNPYTKLELQAAIQPWIDHSISVTYNLPESTTEEEVNNLYMKAWELGLKGLTIYRDKSRDGILKTHDVSFVQHDAPKRPNPLDGEAFHTKVKGELFTVIVGSINNHPYELFAYQGNGITGKGKIYKHGSGSYSFKTEKEQFNITNNLTDEQEAITRGYSYGLRHGGDVKFAVEQLNKTKGDLTSFSKAIARVLKKYIPDGTKSTDKCTECGNILTFEGGCVVCNNCGYSKCL